MNTFRKLFENKSDEMFYFMKKINDIEDCLMFFKIKDEIDLFFTKQEKEYFMSKSGNVSIRIKPKNVPDFSFVYSYNNDNSKKTVCSTSISIKNPKFEELPMEGVYKNNSLTLKIKNLQYINKTIEYDILKNKGLSKITEHPFFSNFLAKDISFSNGYFITDIDCDYMMMDLLFSKYSILFRYDCNKKTLDCLYTIEGTQNGFSASNEKIEDELNNLCDIFDLFFSY